MTTCPPSRETVMTALFALVEGLVPPFTTTGRRMTMPGQGPSALDPILQPALMMWEQHEHDERSERGTPVRQWYVWFVIAFRNDDRDTAGATILNPLLDTLRGALAPDNPVHNTLTLGGLVTAVYVDGPTIKHTGDTDAQGQGGAVIPVTILVP
jgi:hypothetical protein